MSKKTLPNMLSALRILGAICILFCDVAGTYFWTVYLFCGISDMSDGLLARKFDAVTKTGSLLDSIADFYFVVCCGCRILPVLELPGWLWLWTGAIIVIKSLNQLAAIAMSGKCCFPHTTANKMTGFLLFLAVPMTFISIIPITIVATIATFAAIQEGHVLNIREK